MLVVHSVSSLSIGVHEPAGYWCQAVVDLADPDFLPDIDFGPGFKASLFPGDELFAFYRTHLILVVAEDHLSAIDGLNLRSIDFDFIRCQAQLTFTQYPA